LCARVCIVKINRECLGRVKTSHSPLLAYHIVAVCQLANHEADTYFMKTEEYDILKEALDITQGDRLEDYGDSTVELNRIATLWSVIFETDITPNQVALAMIALKITRQMHKNKRDNWVDIAGYSRIGYLATKPNNNNNNNNNND